MRTCNILKILGKGILYGAGATAATAGAVVSYQNFSHYEPNRTMPENTTLESCAEEWRDQNYQKAFYLLCCLLVFAPATVLTFLFTCYQACQQNRNDEHQSLLIRPENQADLPKKSNCNKAVIGIAQGLLATFILLGILGSGWTYKERDIASVFEKQHNNATANECFDKWTHNNSLDFALNVIVFLWTFSVLAPLAVLKQYWEQESEISTRPALQ